MNDIFLLDSRLADFPVNNGDNPLAEVKRWRLSYLFTAALSLADRPIYAWFSALWAALNSSIAC